LERKRRVVPHFFHIGAKLGGGVKASASGNTLKGNVHEFHCTRDVPGGGGEGGIAPRFPSG